MLPRKIFLATIFSLTVNYVLSVNPSYGQNLIKLPKEVKNNRIIRPNTETTTILNPTESLPTSNSSDLSQQFNIYRLDVGDGVSINVPLFPEFSSAGVIDAEGNIVLPILGRVSLVGLSISEVEAKIAYELGQRYLKEQPEVIAALASARPAQVTILGEVVRQGFYPLNVGTPLNLVLQTTGGTTREADLRSIIVRRTLVDGTVLETTVDLYTPLLTGQEIPSVFLQGGDTIIVSRLKVGEEETYDRSLIAQSTLPQQTITVRVLVPTQTGRSLRNLSLPNGSTFIDVVASLPPEDGLLIDEDITLLRFDPEKRGVISQELDTKEVIDGDIAQNVLLQDEDVIVVSRTLLGEVFSTFTTITRPITTILGFRRFFNIFLGN